MIDKIQCERRIGYDIEPYVIATLSALRDGWIPPERVSEAEYAVDFDGTLCVNEFPKIGAPNKALIAHLIKKKAQGNKLILWTCRVGERLQEAVDWCKAQGLDLDTVNENLPEIIAKWGRNNRKVFADVYIDDKAVNKPKYHVPYKGEEL